ncbi:tetratricopeptide repeat protein [Arachidicoccus terrestris]|uniref:tetratricopeptide repeat protein n=1 Tax=Arachidicoccus terrestris TaxID=2875539 RepID=UPI001CC4C5EE|nr:tetratricopeptide repeat protein [Arachidicoccus terrestris]UAY55974.1 tetratricopeptide repeat protein [Arachidicoccus terrestris]
MREDNYREEQRSLKEWLAMYEQLRTGAANVFLEEDVFLMIIEYYDEQDKVKKAMEAVDIALEYYPYSTPLLVKKADYLIVYKQLDQAMEVLDQAMIYDSRDVNIYILKTEALLAMKKKMEAKEILQAAMELFEGEELADLLFELADVFDDYELYNDVFNCLVSILEIDPNNEEALYKICFWTDFTNRHYEGIQIYKRIIDAYPYNDLAWFNLGAAYQCIKRYEKALDAYEYAIAINEKFDYAYRNMGDALIHMRRYKEAIEVLKKTLELSKPDSIVYEAIGYCYHRLLNGENARFYFRKAINMSPTESKLYYKIALTYMDEMKWSQALKSLDTAMAFNQDAYEYELAKGECLMNMEEYTEAIYSFGTVVKHRRKSVTGWSNLIKCMYLAGAYEDAEEQAAMAYELTGGKAIFLYFTAFAQYEQGRVADALINLESALVASPKQFKKVVELNPAILQNHRVVSLLAQYKKPKK